MPLSGSVSKFFTATGFSFVAALLLSIAVALYSLHTVRKFQEAEIWIDHTQDVIQTLEESLSTVKDLVSSSRGYALTGKSEYLSAYNAARATLPQMLNTLRSLVSDNAGQMKRQAGIAALVAQRIETTQQLIRRDSRNQVDIFSDGLTLNNQIRTGFADMKEAEQQLLKQRSEDSRRRARLTRFSLIGGNLLSIAILVSVFIRLQRETGQRRLAQLQAQESARKSDGLYQLMLKEAAERKENEARIADLNTELSARAAQLELANKELEGFSYSVSHDLRAPLRVIGGYSLMLEEDCAEALDDEGKRYLNVIRTNTRKMDALIVDLLKLARSSLVPLTIATIDMRQMVSKAVNDLKIESGNTVVTIEDLHAADANATLILQIWENLLANAAKFSGKQAQPAIRVSSQQSPTETVYCIEDNGVGFDVQKAPKLFEVFQRFHAQEIFPGTGVGLALVKRIATRHGGRVWAESSPGNGARFYFSLPIIPTVLPEPGYTSGNNLNEQSRA